MGVGCATVWHKTVLHQYRRRPISAVSRWMLTYAAKVAFYRSFRDDNSKDFVTGLGVDTRQDEVYPDLAFRLSLPELTAARAPDSSPVTVAVGLMQDNGWRGHATSDTAIYGTYLTKMACFVSFLLTVDTVSDCWSEKPPMNVL